MKRLLLIVLLGLVACGCGDRGGSGLQGRSKDPRMAIGRTWQWEGTITPVERNTVPDPEPLTRIEVDEKRAGDV